jgi:hypothetical protein
MSRSSSFCILLVVCLVCVAAVILIGGERPAAGQEGLRAPATAAYESSVSVYPDRLAAHGSPLSLLLTAQATPDPTWSALPVQGGVLDALQALRLVGFDTRVLSGWRMAEVADLMAWLQRGIWFEGDWSSEGLQTALQGLHMMLRALDDNPEELDAVLGTAGQGVLVYQVCAACYATGSHYSYPEQGQVTFDSNPDLVSFLHENGHIVDYHLARDLGLNTAWGSDVMLVGLGWHRQTHQSGEAGAYYLDNGQDAPHSEHSPREDFADTFAAWVLGQNHQPLPARWRTPSDRRALMLSTLPGIMLQ